MVVYPIGHVMLYRHGAP